MKDAAIVRFRVGDRILQGGLVGGKITADGEEFAIDDVELLSPSSPSKVICVGLNYIEHALELKMKLPDEPIIFLKPPTAVIGHEAEIVMPKSSSQVDYEGELGIVIMDCCRHVPAKDASRHVMGYTCFNDVTARDLQKKDGQWTRAKSFDTFAPIGPWIAPMDIDAAGSLDIVTRVNSAVRQSSNTSDLIFSLSELVEFISGIMTLLPGDVIATGTPPGVGKLEAGDTVEVEIEGIGILRNRAV